MIEDYNEYKKIIDDHLIGFLPAVDSKSATLYEAMKYSIVSGGKRLRATLVLSACEFAGGSYKDALPYAAAIEYIHTYSLIHDDLPAMDDDDLRRGVPTNHKKFGEAMAILAGDGLLNTAYEIMSRNMMLYFDQPDEVIKRVNAMHTIAKYAGVKGMVAGQVSDIESENCSCSNEMLEYIHLNKTAALITASVMAGLYIGGADEEVMRNMRVYAENLGLAFQIADDILDVKGDPKKMGKETGKDQEKSKVTYVSINGMEKSEETLAKLTEEAIEAIAPYYDNAEFFRNLVIKLSKRTA